MRCHASRSIRVFIAGIPCLAVTLPAGAAEPDNDLNAMIRPYSAQQIVGLDIDESYTFTLKKDGRREIKLIGVEEHKDSVNQLMRRADIRIKIDGKPVDLSCEPYQMPTEINGVRILADTTSGWGNIAKRVQFSIWDATDPIVDAQRFTFPIADFRFLSHGTQCYNEAVHLGATDDDPAGNRFYHDYGFDNAGFEGRDVVISAIEGKVVKFWPSREDLCSVVVQDRNGLNWEFGHLKSVEPETVIGASVIIGQKLGLLGKTGPSGNFAHLHLGTYLSMHDLDADVRNTRLNLYPWLVAAYQAKHPKGLAAIARPHHIALTGEKVVLDGAHSLTWGGGKIVEYRWVLPDGRTVKDIKADLTLDQPGACVAALWVKDDRGHEDVDFCQVKAFTKDKPESNMPHIFMTYTPTLNVKPDQPVTFRFWVQGQAGGPVTVEFDDGTRIEDYKDYAEFAHRFKTPGVHEVTARCAVDGKPITQKLKVVVERIQSAL